MGFKGIREAIGGGGGGGAGGGGVEGSGFTFYGFKILNPKP